MPATSLAWSNLVTLPGYTFRSQTHVTKAASSTGTADTELVPSSGFRIEQISFGKILSPIGIGLMTYGFGAFFGLLPGGDVSSLLLIYGFPISLLGFALAYAQLKPVPCKTTKAAFELRDSQMTDIQKQVQLSVPVIAYALQALKCCSKRIYLFYSVAWILSQC